MVQKISAENFSAVAIFMNLFISVFPPSGGVNDGKQTKVLREIPKS